MGVPYLHRSKDQLQLGKKLSNTAVQLLKPFETFLNRIVSSCENIKDEQLGGPLNAQASRVAHIS